MRQYFVVVVVLAVFAQVPVSGVFSQAWAGPQTESGKGQAKQEVKAVKPESQTESPETETNTTPKPTTTPEIKATTPSPSHPQSGSPYRVDYAHGYYYYTAQSGWVWVYQDQSHVTSRTSYYQPTTSSYSYPSYQPAASFGGSFGGNYCRT